MAHASPWVPGKLRPACRDIRMYTAHIAAAAMAKNTPARSGTPEPGPTPLSSTTPASARAAHSTPPHFRDSTTDSASGPSSSMVTAIPSGNRAIAW